MKKHIQKGRGAQSRPANRFLKNQLDLDGQWKEENIGQTRVFHEHSTTIVNKVNSPDLGFLYSMNPYQGCEHGCAYCYARPTHEYWGFNAGLDFESKIIVKENAATLLERKLLSPLWKVAPIVLSGNTDCYQPLERKFEITRNCLQVFLKYRHPVGIITKNALIERDLDLLQELASMNLVHVNISLTTLNQALKSVLEPRTSSVQKVLQTIEVLVHHNIPVNVMVAPIIPGLNDQELPQIVKRVAQLGVYSIGFTMLRLNGSVGPVFENWLEVHFPSKASKIISQVRQVHGGQSADYAFGRRMKGEGPLAAAIHQLFTLSKKRYMKKKKLPPYNLMSFRKGGNLSLF